MTTMMHYRSSRSTREVIRNIAAIAAMIALLCGMASCGAAHKRSAPAPHAQIETPPPQPPPPPPPPEPPKKPPPAIGERAVPKPPMTAPGHIPEPNYTIVKTYFATDRNLTADTTASGTFGGDRAVVTYGTCDVSIPRDHQMGEMEAPSIWRLEFREDPAKHVVLLKTLLMAEDRFFADVTARVHASRKSNAFLFVHGYNVSFADAARRTAQISYDLGFDGAPVFYSWPSQGATSDYTIDEQNVEWAQTDLKNFLDDFFARSKADHIFLIAHSMGNRALTRAISSLLQDKPAYRARLQEVILAAPDIDADVFKRDIAPALAAAGRPITMYASSRDLALMASKEVHGYLRAGESGLGLVVVPGIETIDASSVDTGLVGHSYFADTRSVISDIYGIISGDRDAARRDHLVRIDTPAGPYWKLNP